MYNAALDKRGAKGRLWRHYAKTAAALLVIIGLANGLFAAYKYTTAMAWALHEAVPAMAEFDVPLAAQWHDADTTHVTKLQQRWPWSLPEIVAEMAFLWWEHRALQPLGIISPRGYRIVPAGLAGKDHAYSAAIGERLQLLVPWGQSGHPSRTAYAGYLLDTHPDNIPASPGDVQSLLDALPLPDAVFHDLKIVLLPYALHQAAGLGGAGHAIIGAAPNGDNAPYPYRTAYAVLHELGHHIHFRYMDARGKPATALWAEYMELRGIQTVIASGPVNTESWSVSARETFAEDFRLLFGPPQAIAVPHGTKFGDPRITPGQAEALREFMLRLVADS